MTIIVRILNYFLSYFIVLHGILKCTEIFRGILFCKYGNPKILTVLLWCKIYRVFLWQSSVFPEVLYHIYIVVSIFPYILTKIIWVIWVSSNVMLLLSWENCRMRSVSYCTDCYYLLCDLELSSDVVYSMLGFLHVISSLFLLSQKGSLQVIKQYWCNWHVHLTYNM